MMEYVTYFILALLILIVGGTLTKIFGARQQSQPQPGGAPVPPPPAKSSGWGFQKVLIVMAIIGVAGGVIIPKMKGMGSSNTIQPTERWVATWSLPEGEYERGQNEATFEALIIKNAGAELWFDTMYKYRGKTRVTRHFLTKKGDRYDGTWYQDEPSDSGTLYLKKLTESTWVGQETDKKGRKVPYTLICKEKK